MFSCKKEKIDRKALHRVELEKKINNYRLVQSQACSELLLEEITEEVDSLMYFLVQQMNGETGDMPPRPNRPVRLVDTIRLEEKKEVK